MKSLNLKDENVACLMEYLKGGCVKIKMAYQILTVGQGLPANQLVTNTQSKLFLERGNLAPARQNDSIINV